MPKNSFSQFKNDLTQLESFVYGFEQIAWTGTPYGIDSKTTIIESIPTTQLKLFEYCTSVIRAYSVFERFVFNIAETWIQWALKIDPEYIWSNPTCRTSYEMGVAEIFKRQTEVRFLDIDRFHLGEIHSHFDTKSSKTRPLNIPIEPFTANLPNLKSEQIDTLFKSIALKSPATWLKQSKKLLELADEYSISHSEALKDIVARRNEVAHGNPDPSQLLGSNELISRIQIIKSLGEELRNFTIFSIVDLALNTGKINCIIGSVSKHWAKRNAFELISENLSIISGETVLVIEDLSLSIATITSLQVEGVGTNLYFGPPKTPLGLKMDILPNKGARLVRMSAIPDLKALMDIPPTNIS